MPDTGMEQGTDLITSLQEQKMPRECLLGKDVSLRGKNPTQALLETKIEMIGNLRPWDFLHGCGKWREAAVRWCIAVQMDKSFFVLCFLTPSIFIVHKRYERQNANWHCWRTENRLSSLVSMLNRTWRAFLCWCLLEAFLLVCFSRVCKLA